MENEHRWDWLRNALPYLIPLLICGTIIGYAIAEAWDYWFSTSSPYSNGSDYSYDDYRYDRYGRGNGWPADKR